MREFLEGLETNLNTTLSKLKLMVREFLEGLETGGTMSEIITDQ